MSYFLCHTSVLLLLLSIQVKLVSGTAFLLTGYPEGPPALLILAKRANDLKTAVTRCFAVRHEVRRLAAGMWVWVGFDTTFVTISGRPNRTPTTASVGKRDKQPILISCNT